jgi:hypothetical protein
LGRSACAANRQSCIGSIRLWHVLVLQGGGDLGACQAGTFDAMEEACRPTDRHHLDWHH